MDNQSLIAEIVCVLRKDKRIRGAWLTGSFGRGDADRFSDVDILVLVAGSQQSEVFEDAIDFREEIAPIIYTKTVPQKCLINSITKEWQRFDLTFISYNDLETIDSSLIVELFDLDGVSKDNNAKTIPTTAMSPSQLKNNIIEFIRILGLTPVVCGRNELVVGQTGSGLLRDILIQTMLAENSRPVRGLMSLSRNLTEDQQSRLLNLPLPAPSWPTLFKVSRMTALEFFPRARRLASELNVEWPERFESATRDYLLKEIGADIDWKP